MNYLDRLTNLHNHYYGMRHGQSLANLQQLIISTAANGLRKDYGLSDFGSMQVRDTAERADFAAPPIIYSSDFSRARQTAEILQHITKADEIVISPALRERNFGIWEKTHHENYERVWRDDARDSISKDGVESVHDVLTRVSRLLLEIETNYNGKDIVLVSHGDTLQIAAAGLAGLDPTRHRDQEPWETAQLKRLV